MVLTPDILRAAYNYLSETEPFVGWNLPDGEDIKFKVTHRKKAQGCTHCVVYGDKCDFVIEISDPHHDHTASLMLTMAHEMVHVHQRHNCINRAKASHGTDFLQLAQEVCTVHGFDPGQF